MREVLITLKAIEYMSYGIDITKFTSPDDFKGYVNSETKKYISRQSSTVVDFIWELDTESKNFLKLYADFVIRHGKNFYNNNRGDEPEGMTILGDKEPNIKLTKPILLQTMQTLYKMRVCTYSGVDETLLDPDILARMEKIDAEFNRYVVPTDKIVQQLSKEKTAKNFGVITSVAYSNATDIKNLMLTTYKDVKHDRFNIKSLKDFPVIDERIYIPLSEADWFRMKQYYKHQDWNWELRNEEMKYIVVSKNLYDYYFCSYGSEFQSCYSLTSDHAGWYGMLPFGTFDSHYIIYGTKAEATKCNITGDNCKWDIPFMFFRCWGWADTHNQLLLDKGYTNRERLFRAVKDVVLSKFMEIDRSKKTMLLESEKMKEFFDKHRLRFYPDSIRRDEFSFVHSNGTREFIGCNGFPFEKGGHLYNQLQSIKEVKDTFNPEKLSKVVDGVLLNPKTCPITMMLIDESEKQSKYAKYCNNPVTRGMAVVTWCDGYYKLTTATKEVQASRGCEISIRDINNESYFDGTTLSLSRRFSGSCGRLITLKSLKEKLKGHVDKTGLDLILLKVVEDEKVSYIKYKPTGGNV